MYLATKPANRDAVAATQRWHLSRGELRIARPMAAENMALAERLGDPLLLGLAHSLIATVHWYSGDLVAARPHFESGLAVCDPERDRAKTALYDVVIGALCHMWLACVLYCQGSPDEALHHATEAIAVARTAA